MRLYLTINKAVQMPATGQDSKQEDRAKAEESRSYSTQYAGAASGEGMNAGSVTKAAATALGETEADREAVGALDPNLVASPKKDKDKSKSEEVPVGKALAALPSSDVVEDYKDRNAKSTSEASRIMKAVLAKAENLAASNRPNTAEVEFLKSLGYTEDDISVGAARITGRTRSRFNQWLQHRMLTSIETLTKSVRNL